MTSVPCPAGNETERGAVLVLTAAAMLLIMGIAAITVDLAATRNDRSHNQAAADSAAAAAVVAMSQGSPAQGCEAATDYLEYHLDTSSLDIDCSVLLSGCDTATSARTVSGTSGTTTVSITYPVPDTDPLMGSSTVGLPVVTGTKADGDACDRIAVLLTEDRSTFFAGVVGVERSRTSVHSVALAGVDPDEVSNINLLLLNKTDCATISVSGGGSNGGVTVLPVVDPVTGEVHPGSISVDSDGSACGGGGAISTSGAHAQIRADGAPGCTDELVAGTGQGCGVIEAFANGASNCVTPNCGPTATSRSARVTRAQLDYRWNCRSTYPASFEIDGCPDAGVRSSYIDDLVANVGFMGIPAGFSRYSDHHDCNIGGGPKTDVVVDEGNWVVDCDLNVARPLTFLGGNIIFNGDVDITANGVLKINDNNTGTYDWSPGNPVERDEHSAGAAYVFFRDGTLSKAGGGSLSMKNTFTYLSSTSSVQISGGHGEISLVAPTEGPFEDLALWSDSSQEKKFAGNATVEMEGVFFAPYASVRFQGNGSQSQVAAQFIADKLTTGGNGSLSLAPIWERSVQFPQTGDSQLIR